MKSLRERMWGIKAQKVSISLPFGLGGVELVPNKVEQRAAWSLYVELTTRIAIQPFDPEHGLMREVLTSLYSLFGLTRQVLREAGPEVAHGPHSLGPLAIEILTKGLAPYTTRWHRKLLDYESARTPGASPLQHERAWADFPQMRKELEDLQREMKRYAEALAKIAGAR
jgi:hypothetical protein